MPVKSIPGRYPNRIKELREGRGLSGVELANHLGCSSALICYYEKGRREISHNHLKKLSLFFRVPIRELYLTTTGEVPQPKRPGERQFCTQCRGFYTGRTCPVCAPPPAGDKG